MWCIWIDTGGTFTDCLAVDPDGGWHRSKVLSSGALRARVGRVTGRRAELPGLDVPLSGYRLAPVGRSGSTLVASSQSGRVTLERPLALRRGDLVQLTTSEPAPLLAARLATHTPLGERLPPHRLRLATTLGTNALLQRRGAPTALFVTRGFGDLLSIGTQQRPDLFSLSIHRPAPLPAVVIEVDERVAADGAVLLELDLGSLRAPAGRALARGVRSAAVALVHSHRNPEHEQRLGRMLSEMGFAHVSCSASVAPVIGLLTRAETAVVNAYLAPVVEDFIGRVEAGAGAASMMVMTSAGAVVRGSGFAPKDSLLSGPAGGVVGAALAGQLAGFQRVISFDMGGTSTDVARFDGASRSDAARGGSPRYDYSFEQRVGDAHLSTVALALETVAAGGGSVCDLDAQGALRVGPHSAGADPGPACYGAGGPLTLTDVNLLLGRLDPVRFGIPVDVRSAEQALEALRRRLRQQRREVEALPLLQGLLDLANEQMAEAIRRVSVRRGYDVRDHALVAFGGAGPQHACGVARRLGIDTVVVPPDAGLLSALGVGHAAVERVAVRQVLRPLARVASKVDAWLGQLADEAYRLLQADDVPPSEARIRRRLAGLRLAGQDTALTVDLIGDGDDLTELFQRRFQALYGYPAPARALELESLRVMVGSAERDLPGAQGEDAGPGEGQATALPHREGPWPCHDRDALGAATVLPGPAVVTDRHSTTVVESGWEATRHPAGALILRRAHAEPAPVSSAVELELFVGRMGAMAQQMGELLRRTALSTNIKQRQDYSCALLDARGELVINAPHVPVHLGSLGLCVRQVMRTLTLGPGDVALTNHPAYGGSHLPDVTVITPVYDDGVLVGHVASRAHHAEIGGIRPGSMPPDSRTLAQEGVVLPPMLLVAAGRPRWTTLERLLRDAPYPSRAVEDNLADVAAQVAANHLGATALARLSRTMGRDVVRRQMALLGQRAARLVEQALMRFRGPRIYTARDQLDDGTPLSVRVEISAAGAVRFDFEGSGAVHPGNLNATPAIVRSVVIYVLRLLLRQPLPLNEGLMQAVQLRLPPGLLDPSFPDDPTLAPAVVGGNVETSQRLVDLLLQALGLAACSQGTMNNLVFGTQRFGYYETVGGGAGGGPDFDGASGVHTHMTNTRITDVELLEQGYPVRVERFALRRGSGGAGLHPGGDGLVRELTFLQRMDLSLLTQRRTTRPCGLGGGAPGLAGAQRLVRADGTEVELGGIAGCTVEPGDRLVLLTPGGGGWGAPSA